MDTRDKVTILIGRKKFTIFLTELNALLYVIRRRIRHQFTHIIAPYVNSIQWWNLNQQLK